MTQSAEERAAHLDAELRVVDHDALQSVRCRLRDAIVGVGERADEEAAAAAVDDERIGDRAGVEERQHAQRVHVPVRGGWQGT